MPLYRARMSVFNYDEIPPGYYYHVLHKGSAIQQAWHRLKFEEVIERIPQGAERLLDFGCGSGGFLSLLAKSRPQIRAVGVDVASVQIDFAKANVRFADERIQFFTLAKEKPDVIPFASDTFDIVSMIEVIEHLHPYLALNILREARRVLKPGGKLLLTTPNYRSMWPLLERILEWKSEVKYHDQHINAFIPNSLVKFLEAGGFFCDRLETFLVLAPFTAAIDPRLPQIIRHWEKKIPWGVGNLIVAECTPIST